LQFLVKIGKLISVKILLQHSIFYRYSSKTNKERSKLPWRDAANPVLVETPFLDSLPVVSLEGSKQRFENTPALDAA